MVGTFLANAAGRKVYSSGSHAPTRGRNNPRGYIQREVRRQNQSKARSRLAKKALRRKRAAAKKLAIKRKKRPLLKKKPMLKKKPTSTKKPLGRPTTINTPGIDPNGSAVPNTIPAGSQPNATTNNAPANPYIQINSNGQLDLPYSADYSWEVLDKTQEANEALLELQRQQQEESAQYLQQGRDLDYQYGNQQREILDTNAGRGMAFSSIHGNQVGQAATQYNNARTDLDTSHSQFGQHVGLSRTQIENAFNDMLRQSALMNAEAAAKNAGSLGYGQGAPTPTKIPTYKPPKRRPTRPPKPKKKKGKGKVKGKGKAKGKGKTNKHKKGAGGKLKKGWKPIR